MGTIYAERMAATVDVLQRRCGHILQVGDGAGGLQLLARFLDPDTNDRAMIHMLDARAQATGVQALSEFCLVPAQAGLLFGIARAT